MEALILVGGKGTRLQTLITDRPKPMADVAGKPFLEWIVLSLKRKKFDRIIFLTGYLPHVIRDYFQDGSRWGIEIDYAEERSPLGTGGAVITALPLLRSRTFWVLNGDSYCTWDAEIMKQRHQKKGGAGTLWLVNSNEGDRYGSITLDVSQRITMFEEKKISKEKSILINAGVYLFEKKFLLRWPSNTRFSLEQEILPQLVPVGLNGHIGTGLFLDIGVPETYVNAAYVLADELQSLKEILT